MPNHVDIDDKEVNVSFTPLSSISTRKKSQGTAAHPDGEMQVFTHSEFGTIRVCLVDGEPWFVGKDVAERLGYQNQNRDIVRHVDEDDRQIVNGKTQYRFGIKLGQRGGWLINESGLYSLILSSK